MRVSQTRWTRSTGWSDWLRSPSDDFVQLVLLFAARSVLQDGHVLADIRTRFPSAVVAGCSTAGEICGAEVQDHSAVCCAIRFSDAAVRSATVGVDELGGDGIGGALVRGLPAEVTDQGRTRPLRHVLVFSDGLRLNASELVHALNRGLPSGVSVSGGLAGDGADFAETLVVGPTGAFSRVATAVGLYGTRLKVGCGSLAGWDPFGPDRAITGAAGNVLYQLDGQPALALYKRYLGPSATGLPAAGILLPLTFQAKGEAAPVLRTIIAANEADQSLTFAGDVPLGGRARLMKANFERLVAAAANAAQTSQAGFDGAPVEFALVVSCVGRKLSLRQRIEEEVEAVRDVLGREVPMAGFYSYGEIAPSSSGALSELHNQTMTVTAFGEL